MCGRSPQCLWIFFGILGYFSIRNSFDEDKLNWNEWIKRKKNRIILKYEIPIIPVVLTLFWNIWCVMNILFCVWGGTIPKSLSIYRDAKLICCKIISFDGLRLRVVLTETINPFKSCKPKGVQSIVYIQLRPSCCLCFMFIWRKIRDCCTSVIFIFVRLKFLNVFNGVNVSWCVVMREWSLLLVFIH